MTAGCGDDDDPMTPDDGPGATGSATVRIVHEVDGTGFALNTPYTNATGNTYSVANLEYVLSRVTFTSTAARAFESDAAFYVSADDTDTHTLVFDEVPAGDYTAVSFTFGLDETMNRDPDQGGTLPRTPEWEAMRWPATWGGGYHYMKLEGTFETDDAATESFAMHTGRRNATSDPTFGTDPAPIPHFFTVTVPGSAFTVEDDTDTDVSITMNLNGWFEDPYAYDLDMYSLMIMMNTAAQNILEGNGPSVFGDPRNENAGARIDVAFDHDVAGAPLLFDAMDYTTAEGNDYSVKTLRYIVSRVELVNATGGVVAGPLVHYRDAFEDGTRALSIEHVPPASYTQLRITYGLDGELNKDPDQGGDLPQTPEWEAMRWPTLWGGGYHYMQLEGDFRTEGDDVESFATHTGRRHAQDGWGGPPDPEPIEHYVDLTFSGLGLDAASTDHWEIRMVMDVNQWYEDPIEYDLDMYPRMMMMTTAAQDILEANAATVFRVESVAELSE